MISVKVRLLVGLLLAPLVGVGAQATAKAKPATVPDSDAVATAYLAAETRAYAQQLTQWRRAYLARASWADLGDRCNPGALRVFTNDTTPALQAALQAARQRCDGQRPRRHEARAGAQQLMAGGAGGREQRGGSRRAAKRGREGHGATARLAQLRVQALVHAPCVQRRQRAAQCAL